MPSPDTAELAASYLRMMAIGLPASYLVAGCVDSTLRGVGNTRLSFVSGWSWQPGSRWRMALSLATSVYRSSGSLAPGWPHRAPAGRSSCCSRRTTRRPDQGLTIELRGLDRELAGQIARVGVPYLFEQLAFYGSMTAIVAMLAHVDEAAVGAHAVGARVANLLLVPAFALQMASATLVGTALGAGSPERARQVLRATLVAVALVMVPIAVATWLASSEIVTAFDVPATSTLADYANQWLDIVAIAIVLQAVMTAFEGLLLGAGSERHGAEDQPRGQHRCATRGRRGPRILHTSRRRRRMGQLAQALAVQLPLAYLAYRRGR